MKRFLVLATIALSLMGCSITQNTASYQVNASDFPAPLWSGSFGANVAKDGGVFFCSKVPECGPSPAMVVVLRGVGRPAVGLTLEQKLRLPASDAHTLKNMMEIAQAENMARLDQSNEMKILQLRKVMGMHVGFYAEIQSRMEKGALGYLVMDIRAKDNTLYGVFSTSESLAHAKANARKINPASLIP